MWDPKFAQKLVSEMGWGGSLLVSLPNIATSLDLIAVGANGMNAHLKHCYVMFFSFPILGFAGGVDFFYVFCLFFLSFILI